MIPWPYLSLVGVSLLQLMASENVVILLSCPFPLSNFKSDQQSKEDNLSMHSVWFYQLIESNICQNLIRCQQLLNQNQQNCIELMQLSLAMCQKGIAYLQTKQGQCAPQIFQGQCAPQKSAANDQNRQFVYEFCLILSIDWIKYSQNLIRCQQLLNPNQWNCIKTIQLSLAICQKGIAYLQMKQGQCAPATDLQQMIKQNSDNVPPKKTAISYKWDTVWSSWDQTITTNDKLMKAAVNLC